MALSGLFVTHFISFQALTAISNIWYIFSLASFEAFPPRKLFILWPLLMLVFTYSLALPTYCSSAASKSFSTTSFPIFDSRCMAWKVRFPPFIGSFFIAIRHQAALVPPCFPCYIFNPFRILYKSRVSLRHLASSTPRLRAPLFMNQSNVLLLIAIKRA